MRMIATFAFGAMLLTACAHSPPPPPAEIPPAHQADAPPPAPDPSPAAPAAPSARLRLQMDPRPGWVALPASEVPEGMSGVLLNPTAHAMIMIMVDAPATLTAREAATALRTQFSSPPNTWRCGALAAWPDADGAAFTVSQGTNRGKIAVRRLHDGPAVNVLFMGRWPAGRGAAAALADYDAMVSAAAVH